MKTLQNEIWLEFNDLLQVGVKEATLWNGVLRNSPRWQAIPDPDDARRRLIRYATLADKYQQAVRDTLCCGLEPGEWLVMKEEEEKALDAMGRRDGLLSRVEDICEEGYKRYLHLYRGATPRQQRCLSRAAGIVDVAGRWYVQQGLPWRSYEPVKEIAAWVAANQDEYFPLKYCPTNPTRLKEKVMAHAIDGKPLEEVIALPRSGNDNRASHKHDTWWQATALHLRTSGRNLTQSAIVRKLTELAELTGQEAPSESTVRALLRDKAFLTADAHQDLASRHRHRHRASMPIAQAMYVDDCWEMDGTRVQLAPHLTKDGLKFLYIVVCRDVHSGAYLGWHFGTAESGHSYRMALKMAVSLTGRLPYELRYDRFPGHNSPEIEHLLAELERAGVTLTKTSTATGKARAERSFYTLQQVFESDHLAYWGQGIRATTASAHPTEAYRYQVSKELKNAGWDFDAAWMAECGVIAAYNHTPLSKYSRKHAGLHLSPWQIYENGADESAGRSIEAWEVAELFWATRQEGIRNRCIRMTVKGHTYRYDLLGADHYEILNRYQAPNLKLTVRYEPHDLSRIMLFDEAGNFLAEVAEQQAIQLYGKDAQWDQAAKWKQKSQAVDVRRREDLEAYLAQLPAEAAALMPTKLSKHVTEDAQTRYMLENAAEWQAAPQPKAPKEAPKARKLDDDTFDPEAWARSQY